MKKCVATVGYSIGSMKAFPIRCGKWDCEYCARLNADAWSKRIRDGVRVLMEKHEVWFWTLTEPSSVSDMKTGLYLLPKQWDTLRKIYQRWASDNSVEAHYCAAIEPHQKRGGTPHLHIIWLAPGTNKVRRDWAKRAGFGYIHHATKINDVSGVGYLAKYQGKGTGKWPKNFRRVRLSRKWPEKAESDGLTECLVKVPSETLEGFAIRVAFATGEEPRLILSELLDITEESDVQ